MAKKKNHTNHNQKRKAHRNGIKKFKGAYDRTLEGTEPSYKRQKEKEIREERKRLCELKTQKRYAREKILYGYGN